MGDYLQTRGWEHVDGDVIANAEAQAMDGGPKFEKFWAATMKACKGEAVTEDEWTPYYDILIHLTKKAIEQNPNKNVVLSFAVMGAFNEKPYFKKHFPQMQFINVKVTQDELIKRFLDRHEKMKEEAGFTDQQYWDYHEMDDARAEYGPTFSQEHMVAFLRKTVYSDRLIDIHNNQPDCYEIDNNVKGADTAFNQLNKLAGLPNIKVDVEAVAKINYDRYAAMGQEGAEEEKKE
jgi:hypothetical protein